MTVEIIASVIVTIDAQVTNMKLIRVAQNLIMYFIVDPLKADLGCLATNWSGPDLRVSISLPSARPL